MISRNSHWKTNRFQKEAHSRSPLLSHCPTRKRTNGCSFRLDMVRRYLGDCSENLMRIWEVERSLELPLDGGTVTSHADVILDREKGRPDNLAVVDYKSASDQAQNTRFEQQLAVYAVAVSFETHSPLCASPATAEGSSGAPWRSSDARER